MGAVLRTALHANQCRRYVIRPELPHYLFVLAVAELGYPGLLVLVLLMGTYFGINRRTRRAAARDPVNGRFPTLIAWGLDGSLVGPIVSGCFDTVTWYPFFWILLAMTVALREVVRRQTLTELAAPGRGVAPQRPRGWPATA